MDEFQKKFFGNAFKKENYHMLKKYDMKNPFLTDNQKTVTEAWYQFPIGIFEFFFFSCFVFLKDLAITEIIIYSYLLGIIIAILNWKFIIKPFILLGYVFGGNMSSIINISFAIYFGFNGQWLLTILAIFSAVGIMGLISPSMWIYSFLSTGKPHPKYIFAKRYFNQKNNKN